MSKTEFIAEPGKLEVVVRRTFNASAKEIFNAMTDKDAIVQWWGPAQYETRVDKLDVKKGGLWRFVHTDKDEEFAFNGVYHTVEQDKQLCFTFEWEGMPNHVLMETVTLTENGDGTTTVQDSSVFQSQEDRDGMVGYGMEGGAVESLERLAVLLESE